MSIFLLPLIAVVMISLPLYPVFRKRVTGKKAKNAIIFNLCAFFGIMLITMIIPLGGLVGAEGAAQAASTSSGAGLAYIAAAVATGLSSLAAGIAVAAAAPAAIGAVSENDDAFVKSLIFVALGEGCAIYGLLISIMILGKV